MSKSGRNSLMIYALINADIITPFRIARSEGLIIRQGKIVHMGPQRKLEIPRSAEIIDLNGKMIMPGFIDLHVHGGGGSAFNSGNKQDYDRIIEYFISHGTTGLLATLAVDEKKKFLNSIRRISDYSRTGKYHNIVYGTHIEGPYLNRKMMGALNPSFMWKPDLKNWKVLSKTGNESIKMMTIAPELDGAAEIMSTASSEGVVLAIAHSDAHFENIEVAIDNGLSQVSHIFNAMKPMHHRVPGIVTAAMIKQELKVHLIADTVHVHPAVMQLLYKLKGGGGIILVTDAISASGKPDGKYKLAGQDIIVRNSIAYSKSGKLSGSTVTLESAVRNMIKYAEVPLTEAVRMATLNPARVLGIDHQKGVIAAGKDADIVVLDKNFEVDMTIINGKIVYSRDDASGW
jgi:N-acetylglucosamine-6-phosphate deacetylase